LRPQSLRRARSNGPGGSGPAGKICAGMLLFYATYRRPQASIYRNAGAGPCQAARCDPPARKGQDETGELSALWTAVLFVLFVTICAKRTQFQRGVSSLKFQVSSRKGQASGPLTSNLKLRTSSRKMCKTKPNLAGLRDVGKGVVAGGVARPGSQTCKTNPIGPLGRAPEGQMRRTNPICERAK
jgi:hypothetical protein